MRKCSREKIRKNNGDREIIGICARGVGAWSGRVYGSREMAIKHILQNEETLKDGVRVGKQSTGDSGRSRKFCGTIETGRGGRVVPLEVSSPTVRSDFRGVWGWPDGLLNGEFNVYWQV